MHEFFKNVKIKYFSTRFMDEIGEEKKKRKKGRFWRGGSLLPINT